jgi:hypothetical protein
MNLLDKAGILAGFPWTSTRMALTGGATMTESERQEKLSYWRLQRERFETELRNIIADEIDLNDQNKEMSNEQYAEFFREMERKFRAKPSLKRVEYSYVPPEERLIEKKKKLRVKINECDEQIASLQAQEGPSTAATPEPETEIRGPKRANNDKMKVRAYAKGIIHSGATITRAGLAEQIKETYPEMKYELRTYITWIQDLFPDYTPLTPGRKKNK